MALETAFIRRQAAHVSRAAMAGEVPLSGKTILLHAEQGFGDTIQFVRYAPLVAERGARVICEVQPELVALLSQLEGIEVVARGDTLPPFDLHCPLLSLPLAFGTGLETIPAGVPYLAAPEIAWNTGAIACCNAPRAGFVWSGSRAHKNDANRSIPLARFAALIEQTPFACFSLQRDCARPIARSYARLPGLVDLGSELSTSPTPRRSSRCLMSWSRSIRPWRIWPARSASRS